VSVAPSDATLDRVVDVLGRIVPVAAAIRRGAAEGALTEAYVAVIVTSLLLRDGVPSGERLVLTIAAIVVLAAPPVVLLAFWVAIGDIVKLPKRLGRLGDVYPHGLELERLEDEARHARRPGRFRLPTMIWRFGRSASSTRELLTPWAPLLPLLNVPFLAVVALSALAILIELPLVLVLIVVL
jgi:hypothetical protein